MGQSIRFGPLLGKKGILTLSEGDLIEHDLGTFIVKICILFQPYGILKLRFKHFANDFRYIPPMAVRLLWSPPWMESQN